MKKQVYVVLGMARSGTSAIARGLNALGVDLGEKLTPANARWNAKGFFEDNDIVYKINRGLQDNRGDLKAPAVSLLKQRMAHTQHWGFKDPRTTRLLPFWQSVFAELNLDEHYVIALRNPLSSASSYQSLRHCDLEEALLLWLLHMVEGIEHTHGKNRVIVSYEHMLQSPRQQLDRMKTALHLDDLAKPEALEEYANTFLDKTLRRFEHQRDELASHTAVQVIALCLRVYDALLNVATETWSFTSDAFLTEWASIMREFQAMSPAYDYINRLNDRNKQLERELRTIKKSIVWQLLFPLRWIDDALRARRKAKHKQRRMLVAHD